MRVDKLKLINFRTYKSLSFLPSEGLTVITGENAQGKTNVLEALFMCAFGRSHRTSKDNDLIAWGTENEMGGGCYIGLELHSRSGSHNIEIKMRPGEKKKIFIDRAQAERTGELMGMLNVVMFAPEDLSIIKEGPAERRRFLDMEISQLKPSYYCNLQRYNSVLKQRNALLKDGGLDRAKQLFMWNEQLAMCGAKIMQDRLEFMDILSGISCELHKNISSSKETLDVFYSPSVGFADDMGDIIKVKEKIITALERAEETDLIRCYTSVGPHRDDITVKINGTDVRAFGSQGQKRTAALSLKLSELELIKRISLEKPVLLLDDVLSELDDMRQRFLLESVSGCQCILTCTSIDSVRKAGLNDFEEYNCKMGYLTKV